MYEKGYKYTGQDIEAQAIGKPDPEKGLTMSFQEYLKYKVTHERQHFDDALDDVRRIQVDKKIPGTPLEISPRSPNKPFARSLRNSVVDKLHIAETDEIYVGFYTAVGTVLDYQHGVDAFIELNLEGQSIIVTLDITKNPQKVNERVDIAFMYRGYDLSRDPHAKNEKDIEDFKAKVEEVANKVVEKMMERLSEEEVAALGVATTKAA